MQSIILFVRDQVVLKHILYVYDDFLNSFKCKAYLMKFSFLDSASVDVRPLPGAWVAKPLGVVLGVQDHKKIKFPMVSILANGT